MQSGKIQCNDAESKCPCRYSLAPAEYEQTIFYFNENCRIVKSLSKLNRDCRNKLPHAVLSGTDADFN